MEQDWYFPVTLLGDQNEVGIRAGVGILFYELQRKENWEMSKKRRLGWKMSNNIHQKYIEQREKTNKELRLRIHTELDELRTQEDFILALMKCFTKMKKS